MSKFKTGDRVICLESYGNSKIIGKTGTIKRAHDKFRGIYTVEFDENIGGHSDGNSKDGHAWNVPESILQLAAGGKFKVGDIVRAIKDVGQNDVKGMVGIVRVVRDEGSEDEDYGVEFFGDKMSGHNLGGRIEGETGWFCNAYEIEKIKDLDAGSGYLIGDIVECTQNIDWVKKGTRGIIVCNRCGVSWEEDKDRGHDLRGETKNSGWWVDPAYIKLIKRQAAIPSTPPDGRTVEQVVEDERETIPTTVLKKIPVIYRYIARDSDGKLFAYVDKPTRDIGGKQWYGAQFKAIDAELFADVKWSDDPLEIR